MLRRIFMTGVISAIATHAKAELSKTRLAITGIKNTLAAKFLFCPDEYKISKHVYAVKVDRNEKVVIVFLEQTHEYDLLPAEYLKRQLEQNKEQTLIVQDKNSKEIYRIKFTGIGHVALDLLEEFINDSNLNKVVFQYTQSIFTATQNNCPVL